MFENAINKQLRILFYAIKMINNINPDLNHRRNFLNDIKKNTYENSNSYEINCYIRYRIF